MRLPFFWGVWRRLGARVGALWAARGSRQHPDTGLTLRELGVEHWTQSHTFKLHESPIQRVQNGNASF
jgi:hypothetical protein